MVGTQCESLISVGKQKQCYGIKWTFTSVLAHSFWWFWSLIFFPQVIIVVYYIDDIMLTWYRCSNKSGIADKQMCIRRWKIYNKK